MVDVTVVIPVGPGHKRVADRAAASVHAQSAPCNVVVVHDHEQRGPAWARNAGLAQVTTSYVVFLDADDVLAPTFVARCLAAPSPGRYVYTDWWQGEEYVSAPDTPWVNGTWHLVTSLLPTEAVKAAGGFDETLPGGEDTDFYMKLTRQHRVCGVRVPEALVAYTGDGQRAHAFVHGPDYDRVRGLYQTRYGHLPFPCATAAMPLVGHPDGVPTIALWHGNRRERGVATGHLYPRAGNGSRLLVHPDDARATPHLFQPVAPRRVPTMPPPWVPREGPSGFDAIAKGVGNALGFATERKPYPPPKTIAEGPPAPYVGRVLALYREATKS